MILIGEEQNHCQHILDTVRYFEYLCLDDKEVIHMLGIYTHDPIKLYDALADFAHLMPSARRAALLFYSLMWASLQEDMKKETRH